MFLARREWLVMRTLIGMEKSTESLIEYHCWFCQHLVDPSYGIIHSQRYKSHFN